MKNKSRDTNNKRKTYKIISIAVTLLIVVIGSVILGPYIYDTSKNPEEFHNYIESFGALGPLIMVGIQIAQIVFAFIPGEFVELAAGYVYGAFNGMVLCLAGVFIASAIVFITVRKIGCKLIFVFLSEKEFKRLKFLNSPTKLNLIFFLLYLLPGTPKDIITYFAGLTKIKTKNFLAISTLSRIPTILSSTIVGANLIEKNYKTCIIIYAVCAVIGAIGIILMNKLSKKKTEE